jgi:hypothetical protein
MGLKPLAAESATGEKLFFHPGPKGNHGKRQCKKQKKEKHASRENQVRPRNDPPDSAFPDYMLPPQFRPGISHSVGSENIAANLYAIVGI